MGQGIHKEIVHSKKLISFLRWEPFVLNGDHLLKNGYYCVYGCQKNTVALYDHLYNYVPKLRYRAHTRKCGWT